MAEVDRGNSAKLYTPSVLALSLELADIPLDAGHPFQGHAKSRTCGSEVQLSASLDTTGRLEEIGMQVTACAVGQASAAIFASEAKGLDLAAISKKLGELEDWLKGEVDSSFIARLDLIEPARDYPARHGAILLPWRAATTALSSKQASG